MVRLYVAHESVIAYDCRLEKERATAVVPAVASATEFENTEKRRLPTRPSWTIGILTAAH